MKRLYGRRAAVDHSLSKGDYHQSVSTICEEDFLRPFILSF
jgi:hypothetical protein